MCLCALNPPIKLSALTEDREKTLDDRAAVFRAGVASFAKIGSGRAVAGPTIFNGGEKIDNGLEAAGRGQLLLR